MASTFTGTTSAKLSLIETMIAADVPNIDAADPVLKFAVGEVANIAGVTAIASFSKALAAGVGTIDLTALPHRGTTVSFNGLKVKYLALYNPSANLITLTVGAVNGNNLLGAAFSLTVQPGDYMAFHLLNSQTVAGADLAVDLAGTAAQTISILMAAGA